MLLPRPSRCNFLHLRGSLPKALHAVRAITYRDQGTAERFPGFSFTRKARLQPAWPKVACASALIVALYPPGDAKSEPLGTKEKIKAPSWFYQAGPSRFQLGQLLSHAVGVGVFRIEIQHALQMLPRLSGFFCLGIGETEMIVEGWII